MLWIMACLTNTFKSQDNKHCSPSNYIFKLPLHHFIISIFAFKLAVFQLLIHIILLLVSLLARILLYIFFHLFYASLFEYKTISLAAQIIFTFQLHREAFFKKSFLLERFFLIKKISVFMISNIAQNSYAQHIKLVVSFFFLCIYNDYLQISCFMQAKDLIIISA